MELTRGGKVVARLIPAAVTLNEKEFSRIAELKLTDCKQWLIATD